MASSQGFAEELISAILCAAALMREFICSICLSIRESSEADKILQPWFSCIIVYFQRHFFQLALVHCRRCLLKMCRPLLQTVPCCPAAHLPWLAFLASFRPLPFRIQPYQSAFRICFLSSSLASSRTAMRLPLRSMTMWRGVLRMMSTSASRLAA